MGQSTLMHMYLEKFVSQEIGHFPSESLLKLAKTQEQKDYWAHLALFYLTVSHCWQARMEGNDPLIEFLDNQTIKQWYYDTIWSKVDFLQSLWKLIESAEEHIVQSAINTGQKYPFFDAADLFCHIVETKANNAFSICLKPYHTVSNQAWVKAIKIFRDALASRSIHSQKNQFVKSLTSQYFENSTLVFCILTIFQLPLKQNEHICDNLVAFYKAVDREAELTAISLSKKRSSKNFEKFFSFTWHEGRIVLASKTGGVYNLNKTSQQGANDLNQKGRP
jgi:hypothetical protein